MGGEAGQVVGPGVEDLECSTAWDCVLEGGDSWKGFD